MIIKHPISVHYLFYTLIDCLKHFFIKEKLICVLYKTLLREVYSTGTVHGNISCYTSPICTNILQSGKNH